LPSGLLGKCLSEVIARLTYEEQPSADEAEAAAREALAQQSEELNLSYIEWLTTYFPHIVSKPFSERHLKLWEWFDNLVPGFRPPPRVEVWPRGGAKSSTAELGTAYVGGRLKRRFVLYVSGTQELADYHVQSIGSLLERIGVERAIGKHGNSKGWRRNQLRTATGFNVAAIGLDVATRGIKLDEFRPDLIIFDDIDEQDDSARTIEKKIAAITTSILPAGATDCAVLLIQNLIHELSIVNQIVKGEAGFLLGREIGSFETAITGLQVKQVRTDDGQTVYKVTGGTPTWAGQDLAAIEQQINTYGYRAFLREAQHEVEGVDGYYFDASQFRIERSLPDIRLRFCRAWDFAFTEGGGDYTVGVLQGIASNKVHYVADMVRGQWSSEKILARILACAESDPPGTIIRIPEDPGAGKWLANWLRQKLSRYTVKIVRVTKKKAVRAKYWAERVNSGNAVLVEGEWNHAFRTEHRQFREDEEHEHDDIVDAASDAANELGAGRESKTKAGGARKQIIGFKPA
jgi:predicted phage terminase large subunit-like protein